MTWSSRYKLVTAIYLNSRGFAIVVFEGAFAPLDWSIVETRGSDKGEKTLARIASLFARYRPDVVVLEDMSRNEIQRPHRIRSLNEAIAGVAGRYSSPVVFFCRADVRQQFAYLGSVTKHAIAVAITRHIPAFERFLPQPRKPWESEDARMGLFDAAALALTFFSTSAEKGSDPEE